MTERVDGAVVHFPEWYDDRAEWEAESKGWLSGVEVELPAGGRYPLFCYDRVRLAQDAESDAASGRPALCEPGLVVIPEVTRAAILRAVPFLIQEGFFNHLKPLPVPAANGVAR